MVRSFASLASLVLPLSLVLLGHHARRAAAITLDLSSRDSIKSAAKTVAYNMMTYYTGNRTGDVPGMLPAPYFWWEAGAMWMTLIEYWHYTGDTTYNDVITQALQFQVGANQDYLPANESKSEGNDDQVFWAFAVMSAAELKFPDPPEGSPQWLALAQAVFNQQAGRWDPTCNGGLRWQIYTFNSGYNYKNTISNGGFFQLAARLARYTGNTTYADWANKMYDWMTASPLIKEGSAAFTVYDGTSITSNCSDAATLEWTYNYGTMIAGSAYMYNYTNGSSTWQTRLQGFIGGADQFFVNLNGKSNIMSEIACEPTESCDTDQPSFKAYLTRWLALTSQLAPPFHDEIMTKLNASAVAAAAQCNGIAEGTNGGITIAGTTCGRRWYDTTADGNFGVGEHMSALAIIGSTLSDVVDPPVSADTGGTSVGDPSAGSGATDPNVVNYKPITTSDKAGAGIITLLLIVGTVGGALWVAI